MENDFFPRSELVEQPRGGGIFGALNQQTKKRQKRRKK